jgi:hypothetical protein
MVLHPTSQTRKGFCKGLRSARKQPGGMGGGLQNHLSNINGLAQNSIGYRYTIPQEF